MSSALGIDTVKTHFRSKGFEVWTFADVRRKIHTMDLVQGNKIVMSFRVNGERIHPNHIREVVKRYAAGEKLVHPWTGEVER